MKLRIDLNSLAVQLNNKIYVCVCVCERERERERERTENISKTEKHKADNKKL